MNNTNRPSYKFCPMCGHDLDFIQVQNGISICTARKPPGSSHYCQCDYKPEPLKTDLLKSRTGSMRLTGHERCALDECREFREMEVPSERWPIFESLAEKGLVTLSGARGPGRAWKRAEPVYVHIIPEEFELIKKLIARIGAGYPDDPGTSDLDDEQPARVNLGTVRLAWRLQHLLAEE